MQVKIDHKVLGFFPRVLVACELSGVMRSAFAELGWDAWSCDLVDSEIPGNHLISKGDSETGEIIKYGRWDLLIAHPPCTHLCNSGWWFRKKNGMYSEIEKAADFFVMFLKSDVPHICIENPIMNPYAKKIIGEQSQVIQPHQFGEDASKATCLWLRNLPPLTGTKNYPPRIVDGKKRWGNQTDGGWNRLGPSHERAKERARTYPGIAKAMAEQWTTFFNQKISGNLTFLL